MKNSERFAMCLNVCYWIESFGILQDVDVAPVLPPDSASNDGVRQYAIDPEAAERLWTLSEELTGVKIQLSRLSIARARTSGRTCRFSEPTYNLHAAQITTDGVFGMRTAQCRALEFLNVTVLTR